MEEKYSSVPSKEISTGSWVWNKGLGLGKKIVISGIVISSAPLILPPLFVVSALGLALSVPCGILFATYACTRILMSNLLPTRSPSSLIDHDHDDNNFDDGGDVKEHTRFEDMVDSDDEEKIEIGGYKKDENAGKLGDNMEVEQVIEVEDDNEMNKGSEKVSDVEEGEKLEKDTKDSKDEDSEKTNKENTKKAEKPSAIKKKKVIRKTGGATKKDTETSNGKAVKPVEESQGAEKKVNGKDVDKKAVLDDSVVNMGHERYSGSVMATSEGSESLPSHDMKSTRTVDHPASVSVVPKSSPGKGTTRRSDKVIYSEAEIWENIGILRKIVGYKVKPEAKITEELKAIYQYTGVEPPGLFKDDSTLADMDDKLRFLMSIVGVKVD